MITNNKLILEVNAIDYTNIIDFSIIGSWHPHKGFPSLVITLLKWVLNEGMQTVPHRTTSQPPNSCGVVHSNSTIDNSTGTTPHAALLHYNVNTVNYYSNNAQAK